MGEQVFAIRSSTSLGNEKNLANFEFEPGQFVCATPHIGTILTWPTNLGDAPSDLDMLEREQEERQTDPGADFRWVNSQLYFLPAMTCTGQAMHSRMSRTSRATLRHLEFEPGIVSPEMLQGRVVHVWPNSQSGCADQR